MPVVVATLRPKPGRHEDTLAVFRRHAPAVQAEPGCVLYAVHTAPDRVVIVENWADRAALDAHSAGAALAAIGAETAELLTGPPDVAVLDAVPTGAPTRGLLPGV